MGSAARLVPLVLWLWLWLGALGCRFESQSPTDQRRAAQRAYAKSVSAAELHSDAPAKWGQVQVLQVRFYETAAYKAAQPEAESYLEDWLERANEVLVPNLQARLKLESVVEWSPAASVANLDAALNELAALDPASEVDLVVGLVASSGTASLELHDAGRGEVLGKHVVLRAMDSVAELQLIQSLDMLAPDERARLYARRLEHKQTTLLLHELGHNLGALHTRDRAWIMHPSYHHETAGFALANRELMAVALRQRRGEFASEREFLKALLDTLQQTDDPAVWIDAELAAQRKHLGEALGGPHAGQAEAQSAPVAAAARVEGPTASRAAAPERDASALPAADAVTFREALAFADASDPIAAWKLLQPLLELHVTSYPVQHLGCSLAMSISVSAKQRRAVCNRLGGLTAPPR
jgi:hypothetical protein